MNFSASQLTGLEGDSRYGADLREFKQALCNENQLISEALRTRLKARLIPPILDVGAGLGDIAYTAFPDLEAILLDVHPVSGTRSPRHKQVVSEFFDYVPQSTAQPGTVLLIHVLQYLDQDIQRLQAKLEALNAKSVIAVVNDNTEVFGQLIDWGQNNIPGANPEVLVPLFRYGTYERVERVAIRAHLRCPTFRVLAHQVVAMLLDAPDTAEAMAMAERKLQSLLSVPELEISETIYCYERQI